MFLVDVSISFGVSKYPFIAVKEKEDSRRSHNY